ncbi:hypothetical protein PtB15_18B264 [Puccinia triticina]|nr:hypothetical protein PtB15_18B264 [Puccinia triticina]
MGDPATMRDAADGWISSLVDRLVPQFQAEGTSAGGVPPADQMSPEAIDKARLDPTFLVLKARQARKQAEDLALSITACKRKWEADGALPDEEDIKITEFATISSSASKNPGPFKPRTRKRARKPSGPKPVDLLNKPSLNTKIGEEGSQPPAPSSTPGGTATRSTTALSRNTLDAQKEPQAGADTTRQFESWSSPPPDASPANCGKSGPSNPAAPTDQMPTDPSLPPPANSHCSNLDMDTADGQDQSGGPNQTPLFNPETPDRSAPTSALGQTTSGMAHLNSSDTLRPSPSPSPAVLTIIKSDVIHYHIARSDTLSIIYFSHSNDAKELRHSLFALLTSFANKDNKLRPGTFIPTGTKTQHPESTMVWFLFSSSQFGLQTNRITQAVEALSYLEAVKNSTSSFDPLPQGNDSSSQAPKCFHSVDVLHEFRKIVLDVLMGYIILQTHHLSDAPVTEAKKKAKTRASQTRSTNSTQSVCQVEKHPSELAHTSKDASQNLQRYKRKQNFQPLFYFVLAGVCGLFITSRDHLTAGVSGCMSMIQEMAIITENSKIPHPPDEPIWKSLSAYFVWIFSPVFQSSGQICSLSSVQVPTRMELAHAITNDFLNQWRTFNPTSSFLLPHSSGEIEES